jgi:RNA polymerase sigma-70 factor (ECF subfamily)
VKAISRDRGRDLGLARAAASGDAAAFESLVRDNADAVFGHCLRFFGDHATAEDATQEVFLKVYRRLGTYDGRAAFSTWLFRLAHNTCLDMARAATRRPDPVDPVELPDSETSDPMRAVDDADLLRPALAALPPDERDALAAVGLYEMTYQEAGDALGVPAGTVKSRVFRARRALVAALTGQDQDE